MEGLSCFFVYCKEKSKHVAGKYIHCIAKTGTFFLWVLVYVLIMRLTIFKNHKSEEPEEENIYLSNETDLWQVSYTHTMFVNK